MIQIPTKFELDEIERQAYEDRENMLKEIITEILHEDLVSYFGRYVAFTPCELFIPGEYIILKNGDLIFLKGFTNTDGSGASQMGILKKGTYQEMETFTVAHAYYEELDLDNQSTIETTITTKRD